MDKETLDALDIHDIEDFKSLQNVYIDEKNLNDELKFENEDDDFNTDEEDDDMYSEYQLLPSEDPDELSEPVIEISEEEYERRKIEAFETFDKNYAKVYYYYLII